MRSGQEELVLAATLGHVEIVTKQMELGVCSEVNSAELAYVHQVRRWQPWTREVGSEGG